MPLTKTEWKKLEPKLRFRAFTVAKLGTAEEIEKAKKILIRALKDGETYASTWQTVKETLNGKGTLNPNYWETVFRTNTQSAYIAGKLQKYQETNVKAFQLMVIEDSRTSPFCRSLLDKTTGYEMILPVNHQFWKTYGFPPYHFNCRTSICPVYGSMIGNAGYNVDNPSMNSFRRSKFKPQKGFGGNPLERGSFWDMTDSMKKQAVKFGLMNEFNKKRKTLGLSGNKESTDSKDIKMNKNDILIKKVENEIAGVKKGNPMTFEKADNGNANPNYVIHSPTASNCPACVLSMKARLDGFDIHAKPYDEENEIMFILSENTNVGLIDKQTGMFPEYKKPKERHMPRLMAWFDKNLENNKYYSIEFYWKDLTPDGHIMMITKKNGELMLYDPQINQKIVGKGIKDFLFTTRLGTIKLINLSDCFLNKTVVDYVLEASL